MDSVDQALQTQLKNIQARTGKTLEELYDVIRKSGLAKHGQIRDFLKQNLDIGHGDANTLTTFYLKANDATLDTADKPLDPLDHIYAGAKAALRPIHEKLIAEINTFGTFETAPKKTYVSLRRKKQFAMVGPATNTRIDVGINDKSLKPTPRLIAMPTGSMCPYKVSVTNVAEVDEELLKLLKQSYDAAG